MQCAKEQNRDELIEGYLAGGLSNETKEEFEEHFFECDICFQELRIEVEIGELVKDEGDVLFKKYLRIRKLRERINTIIEKVNTIIGSLIDAIIRRPAWAALSVILIVAAIAGRTPFNEWRSYVNTKKGMELLQNTWTISDFHFRPPGNFSYSIFTETHGSERANPAMQKLKRALEWDEGNRAAKLGLAISWYFTKNKENASRADSMLKSLIYANPMDYESWNMVGLVAIDQGDTTSALGAFQESLRIETVYAEAAYNRALTLQQLERYEDAKEAWEDYLEIDKQSKWSKAATQHLKEIEDRSIN